MKKQMVGPEDYKNYKDAVAVARKEGGPEVQSHWWARLKAELMRRAKITAKRRPTE